MDVMKSDIQPIVPKTNYIALGKESSCVYVCSPLVQKMMKKSADSRRRMIITKYLFSISVRSRWKVKHARIL